MCDAPAGETFAPDPELYDALIDWPRRLTREAPFYRRLFRRVAARSVLDVACGTGRHAAMFHEWGLNVVGADISAAMLDHCRKAWGCDERLRWVQRPFDATPDPPGQFDAAICVGNSLAIAPDLAALRRAVGAMLASVRIGGAVVIQVLNLWRLPEGPTQWQKCRRIPDATGDRILLKGVHRAGRRGFVDIVELRPGRGPDGVESRCRSATILAVTEQELRDAARDAGAPEAETFGDYDGSAYRPDVSPDLILLAQRAR